MHIYSAYDLQVQSDLPLALLAAINTKTDPDKTITIRFGQVSKQGLENPQHRGFNHQMSTTEFWLNIPSLALFHVQDGQSITIAPAKQADEDSIQAFLLSVCMEVLLRQRQLVITPGYALNIQHKGVAILGGSGLGQAMLQGFFYKQGYAFVAGQFVAVNQQAEILPGTTQLECSPQVVSALKLESDIAKTLRPNIKKYLLSIENQYQPSPLPLNIIYMLKNHPQSEVVFSEVAEPEKLACLYQLSAMNQLPVSLCYPEYNLIPYHAIFKNIHMIHIHLPTAGLRLQDVADSIVNDVMTRGHHHAFS